MSNNISPSLVLTRAEAKERGINRKNWKQNYKKVGKLKAKRMRNWRNNNHER